MNAENVQRILKKYGISANLKLRIWGFKKWKFKKLLILSSSVYSSILERGDPLTEEEYLILLDFFWQLGNQARGTNVFLSDNLKLKIIRNRRKTISFSGIIIGAP